VEEGEGRDKKKTKMYKGNGKKYAQKEKHN